MSTETDRQGRLYLPKEVREKYGEKYHIVEYEDRIELIPVADDPLAAVREAAGDLRDASIEEIRDDIEAEAKTDAQRKDADR
ncbi:AbrB/MazE/SpoVT family DNA-binding domain-containing protein [Haladaptatus sp. NG-WS-4]